jgi:putative permease
MDITLGRFLRLIVIIILIAFLVWLVYSLSTIITILIISALMAYILDPIASYFEFRGLSRTQATIIIFVVFFIGVGLIGWFLLPGLFIQLFSLHNSLNLEDTARLSQNIQEFIAKNFSFVNLENLNIDQKVKDVIALFTNELLSILTNLISVISYIVIIPFVVFFLLKDGRMMKKGFVQLIPNRYFEMILSVIHKTDQQLGWYLRGQFTEAFVVGLLSVIALWLLNVQYFIIIGVFAGLANMIPYIGPVAGAIPALAVTIINGGTGIELMYIIFAFAIVQLIDNVVLQPLVLSKSVNLHPLIIVFAVLIGGQFFGVLGMLLAVPAAGILKVTSKELYNGIRKYNRF